MISKALDERKRVLYIVHSYSTWAVASVNRPGSGVESVYVVGADISLTQPIMRTMRTDY